MNNASNNTNTQLPSAPMAGRPTIGVIADAADEYAWAAALLDAGTLGIAYRMRTKPGVVIHAEIAVLEQYCEDARKAEAADGKRRDVTIFASVEGGRGKNEAEIGLWTNPQTQRSSATPQQNTVTVNDNDAF